MKPPAAAIETIEMPGLGFEATVNTNANAMIAPYKAKFAEMYR